MGKTEEIPVAMIVNTRALQRITFKIFQIQDQVEDHFIRSQMAVQGPT